MVNQNCSGVNFHLYLKGSILDLLIAVEDLTCLEVDDCPLGFNRSWLEKKRFHRQQLEIYLEMGTVVMVDRIHPFGSLSYDLLNHRSLVGIVEVEDHFTIVHSLYVGPFDLVGHLNDHRPCSFLKVGHHINLDVEIHHIIAVMTNRNCDHHPFPFHRSLLYPFRYDLEVDHLDHTFLDHRVAFCFRNPYFLCGLDDFPSYLEVVLNHNLVVLLVHRIEVALLLVEELRNLLVIHVLKVAYDHSLDFIRILLLEVGICSLVEVNLLLICFFNLHSSF